jgi:site-specific DNA-methyltransferase (adenine-specific)
MTFLIGDCLEIMPTLPSGSVDMILADLPYGTTQCHWDTVIPFKPLWWEYWRLLKPNEAIVLTASQPFTSALIMSQVERFKYEWIWRKEKGTGFLNAKKQPMRAHESVCVFGNGKVNYFPQMTDGKAYKDKRGSGTPIYNYNEPKGNDNNGTRYPISVQEFQSVGRGGIHPTQKPVALFEYLIKTYTYPGALVFDNVAGSGTTAIAAINQARRWICIESDPLYGIKAMERIANHVRS